MCYCFCSFWFCYCFFSLASSFLGLQILPGWIRYSLWLMVLMEKRWATHTWHMMRYCASKNSPSHSFCVQQSLQTELSWLSCASSGQLLRSLLMGRMPACWPKASMLFPCLGVAQVLLALETESASSRRAKTVSSGQTFCAWLWFSRWCAQRCLREDLPTYLKNRQEWVCRWDMLNKFDASRILGCAQKERERVLKLLCVYQLVWSFLPQHVQ